jgi:hypothetical protein
MSTPRAYQSTLLLYPLDWTTSGATAVSEADCRLTIIRSSTQCPSDIRDVLGKAKVGDLDMAIGAEEEIFWFEIAVDDVEGVEIV